MSLPYIIQIGEVPEIPYPFRIVANEDLFLDSLLRARKKEKELIIRPLEERRTVQQNRALYGVAYPPIADRIGEDDLEHLNDIIEAHYYNLRGGIKNPDLKLHISWFDKYEFKEFYEWLQRWAMTEHGVFVPDPDHALRVT